MVVAMNGCGFIGSNMAYLPYTRLDKDRREWMVLAALPALNEESSIRSVILKTLMYVNKVVVVDDGSSDRTSKFADSAGALVVRHKKNGGYGAAIKTCFETARKVNANVLVILDADGQHNPDDIPSLLKPLFSEEAEIVVGSRFMFKNQVEIPIYRKLGIKILNYILELMKVKVLDSQSGFRAYSKKAINAIDPTEQGMGAGTEILLLAHRHNLRIVEVPIECLYDGRPSTQNPFIHGLSVLTSMLKLFVRILLS